jgi:hypothetical protein
LIAAGHGTLAQIEQYTLRQFIGFSHALHHAEAEKAKILLGLIRVAASDDDKRCEKYWKILNGR